MAKVFLTNQSPATAAAAMLQLVAFLKANGAVHMASGNGVSAYSTTVDVFDPTQHRSWLRLQLNNGTSEILLQCANDGSGVAGRGYRCKFSDEDRFIQAPIGAGAITYNTPPSAADEQFLGGGGDDTSQTSTRLFESTDTFNTAMMVQTTAPYGFWFIAWERDTGAEHALWYWDPLREGSYDPSDESPYAHYFAGAMANGLAQATAQNAGLLNITMPLVNIGSQNGSSSPKSWWRKGLSGEAWSHCPMAAPATGNSSTGLEAQPRARLSTDSITGKDVITPCMYWKDQSYATTPKGKRGVSSFLRWQSGNRRTMTTYSVASSTARDFVVFGDAVLEWDGSVPAGPSAINVEADLLLESASQEGSPPVITIVSPPPGTRIGTFTPIVVEVNAANDLRVVILKFTIGTEWEIAYDEDGIGPEYAERSTVEELVANRHYRFTFIRTAGWTTEPKFKPYAVDVFGAMNA